MKISSKIKAFLEKAALSDSYWANKAKLGFAVSLEERRKSAGLSYKDMAVKLESSPAYMTKVFRGDANLTIESMVKLARATGGQLRLEIVDADSAVQPWSLNAFRVPKHSNRAVSGVSGTVVSVDFGSANNDAFQIDREVQAA